MKPKMTIIGYGKMGKEFSKVFSDGFDVGVSSSRDVAHEVHQLGTNQIHNFPEAIAASSYILLTVPVRALDSVIEKINPYVNANTWAFNICSAAVAAGIKMAAIKCRWFAIHAGFVIGDAPAEIIGYLSQKGYDVLPATAEYHDEQNSIVALMHFIGMATDDLLSESERQYLKRSPASMNLLKLIDHLKANSSDTYWESQIQNKFTKKQRHRLLASFKKYSDLLDQGYFPFDDKLYNITSE